MWPREVIKDVTCQSQASQSPPTLPQVIRTLVCLTNTKQPINYLSLKSCTHEMTSWKVWEFRYLLYLNLNGREQRFINGYWEQTWNNDDGWTVKNSGSAMGIRRDVKQRWCRVNGSQTVVQQWVLGRDVKQWQCRMNGHQQWFSSGYQEETWNNEDVGWTVTNSGSASGIMKHHIMMMLDDRSQTVVQQWVSWRDMKRWCWMNGHKQWFSNGYHEETWNDDVGWTVTNSGSAVGIMKRHETMIMLNERSQTQSTLVIT
jgi:hypothetical protein